MTTTTLPSTAELLNRLSHVLAPPLMSARAGAEALVRQLPAHPEARGLTASVQQAMAILDGMVRLQAAHRDPVPERVPLDDALRAAEVRVAANGRSCEVQAPSLDVVLADPAHVTTIIAELLDNVSVHAGAEVPALVRSVREDGEVRLLICDTGPGLPSRVDRQDPVVFRRGDANGRGAGCGLAICAMLAAANGGRLTLRDGPVGGVEAELVLPAA